MAPARELRVWSYDPEAPSFRHRLAPALAVLEERGWKVGVEVFPKGRYVRRVLERRSRLNQVDVLLLGKINLGFLEPGLLRRHPARVVLDVDDAIWVRKPRGVGQAPGDSRLRRKKFADTCRATDLVLAGNAFLADHARRWAPRVEVVPTPVETGAVPESSAADRRTVVWIGLPENLHFLELVRPALARLARRREDLRLRVVSSRAPDWPEVSVEFVPWSAATEADALRTAGVGIMPLSDDEWTRGKCAFKLLQYMAAGLPCVASDVGANRDVVIDGETGALASTPEQWEAALGELFDDPARATSFGRAGRARVEGHYARRVIAPRTADLIESVL